MRLLMVGELGGQLALASKMAADAGARVSHAPTGEAGLDVMRNRGADLVMIDVAQPVGSFINQLRSEHFAVEVVACGIGTDARAAVDAIRAGAKEYVPLPPQAELIAAVLRAVTDDAQKLIHRDAAMGRVLDLVRTVARSEASILITGESGTGKEVIAREIHAASHRASKPFIAINCAAIPENLLESELFGHEKGAFTGAVARRVGKFEEADGGTLLLDEITEMDVRLQAKLLRAIQERAIDRVGGSRPVPIDIRILATSNRDMNKAVRDGVFREDLLFRLNVVNVRVPALRERPADIKALSDHFARKYADLNNQPYRPVDEDALRALLAHEWPGNVRELENTLHRAVLLAHGDSITVDAIVLPDGTRPGRAAGASSTATQDDGAQPSPTLVGRALADVERDLILDTLKHCLGNRTHAANILGISIRTMRNKLNEYSAAGVAIPSPGFATDRLAS